MLTWIGNTLGVEGLPGIPGRDLNDDEVQQYGGERALIATGYYKRPSVTKLAKGASENKALAESVEEGN